MRKNRQAFEQVIDFEELLSRVDHDQEIISELLGIVKEQLPEQLRLLREALTAGDPKRIETTAHALKGMLANISAAPAAASAARIEELGREGRLQDMDVALANFEDSMTRLMPALDSSTVDN